MRSRHLAQERHFGRAAEKCFVSQPTLSVAIKKLESELDVAIFERSKSSVTVTPLGERIVAQAQRVLEEARTIRELASAGKDQLSTPLKLARGRVTVSPRCQKGSAERSTVRGVARANTCPSAKYSPSCVML